MGVVRREGDWRLEKRRKGVYEITFRQETQLRIITSDAPSYARDRSVFEPVEVRTVESYSEVEGLFEEKAHGPPPLGMEYSTTSRTTSRGSDSTADFDDLPPMGIGFVFLLAGSLAIYIFWDSGNSNLLLVGGAMVAIGFIPFGYAGYLYRKEDWRSAWNFLVTVDETNKGKSTSADGSEKTPPPSQKLKNTLFFDRAAQHCEWCGDPYDHLEVHHIVPRSESGPNEPENLIVLCPNCHEKADRNAIPRSKLEAKVKRLKKVSVD